MLSKNYLDLTDGLLLYTNQFWIGFLSAHLNKPKQSLTGGSDRIPIKYDLLTGFKINIKTNQTMRYLSQYDKDVWILYFTLQVAGKI